MGGVDPGQHEWYRLAGRWHAAFALLDVLAAGLVAVDGELGAGRRVLGVALLAALAGWYAAVGAKRLRLPRSTGGWRYVAVAGGLATAAFAAAPPAGALLAVLFPHVWAMLPTRHAVAGTAGIVVALSGVLAALVKSHVMRIFDKLGVKDRTAAVTTAMARGILPPA
ncbi:hypothetical protein GCM10009827_074770 [Dactylosporangium maewongense]|uniref:Uncharacterized protein n=2 Tax=Dactylosporangium maewongense TaxID=634393 RepID=A0ABN2BMN3_9ACTN